MLGLCAEAGIVEVAVLAVDGTKLEASASNHATRSYEQIAQEILAEAGRIDAAEDELYGEARGDELPEELRTREGAAPGFARPRSALERRARQRSRQSRCRGSAQKRLETLPTDAPGRRDWRSRAIEANRAYEAYRAARGDARRAALRPPAEPPHAAR